MKFTLGIFLLCFLFACSTLNKSNSQEYIAGGESGQTIKEKDGKCYAKAMMPTTFNEKKEYVAVYTGDKMVEGVVQKITRTQPATTKWVKKGPDPNCLSPDPNDCLVWCLVEVPAESEILKIVTDTSKIKDFVMRPISTRTINDAGGVTKEIEILCPSEETPETVRLICSGLVSKGYLKKDEVVSFPDSKMKSAITLFQRDFGLPVGQFNMPTMKALGVK